MAEAPASARHTEHRLLLWSSALLSVRTPLAPAGVAALALRAVAPSSLLAWLRPLITALSLLMWLLWL